MSLLLSAALSCIYMQPHTHTCTPILMHIELHKNKRAHTHTHTHTHTPSVWEGLTSLAALAFGSELAPVPDHCVTVKWKKRVMEEGGE